MVTWSVAAFCVKTSENSPTFDFGDSVPSLMSHLRAQSRELKAAAKQTVTGKMKEVVSLWVASEIPTWSIRSCTPEEELEMAKEVVSQLASSAVKEGMSVGTQTLAEMSLWAPAVPSDDSAVPTWADDTAVMFATSLADELPQALSAATCVCNGLARLGLRPNLGPGKTEAVLLVQGAGTQSVRRRLFCADSPGVSFMGPDGLPHVVRISQDYVHLGTLVRSDLHEIPNIKRRAALARKALVPLRRRIFCNDYTTPEEKRELLVQRVFAKFLHGSGLWRLGTAHEQDAASEPIRSAQRSCVKAFTGVSSQGLDSSEVAALLDVPTAEKLLSAERLRTSLEVIRIKAAHMWEAIVRDGVWLAQVHQDLLQASRVTKLSLPIPQLATPAQVRDFLYEHASTLRGIGNAYLRSCRHLRKPLASSARSKAIALGVPEHRLQDTHPVFDDGHLCMQCGRTFATARVCAVHLARHHSIPTRSTQVCYGTRCEVCLQEFWTSFRLQQHLEKSSRCLETYWHGDVAGTGHVASEDRREHSARPAVVTPGPKPFWAIQDFTAAAVIHN